MAALVVVAIIKKSDNTIFSFYLGDKKSDKYVSGISAQTSGFGGYVFMTLPGLIYAYGANKAWVAAGLFLGTMFMWIVIPERLRKYSNRSERIVTIPEYLEYRFGCKNSLLKYFSGLIVFAVLTIMSICSFALVGRILSSITNLSYGGVLLICLVIVVIYIVVGGYTAVCLTDYIQGLLMLIGIFSISIVAIMLMGKEYIVPNIFHSGLQSTVMEFLNVFEKDGSRIAPIEIFSQVIIGLGICGLPQVLVRFMGIKNGKTLVKSRRVAVVWGLSILTFSCIAGVIGRAYLYPVVLDTAGKKYEYVYVEMIKKAFEQDINTPFVTGILLCSAVAAIMAALDSQILTAASAISNDILCCKLFANASEKNKVLLGRVSVFLIAVFSCFVAYVANIDVNEVLSDCWSCLGSGFGPTIIMSLYWKRMNGKGAFFGMVLGIVSMAMWGHIGMIDVNGSRTTLEVFTGINAIAIGFVSNIVVSVFVSLVTKPISKEKVEEFVDVITYAGE